MNQNLTSEQLEALRSAVRGRLEQEGAQEIIRDIANRSFEKATFENQREIQTNELLEEFKKTGILETILSQINDSRTQLNVSVTSNTQYHKTAGRSSHSRGHQELKPQTDERYLYFCVHGGKAFTEHFNIESHNSRQETVSIMIDFRKQRFDSKNVPFCLEPAFDDSFLLKLSTDVTQHRGKAADLNAMLSMSDQIHVAIVKQDANGIKSLISSQFIEWRHLLYTPGMSERTALPMYGIGSESKIVVGVIDISLELIPSISCCLQKEVVSTQFDLERSRINEKNKSFFSYAKYWWKEFLQIRPENNSRLLKIFAQDENGNTRSVCSFVRCLRGGRVLESTLHALRSEV